MTILVILVSILLTFGVLNSIERASNIDKASSIFYIGTAIICIINSVIQLLLVAAISILFSAKG